MVANLKTAVLQGPSCLDNGIHIVTPGDGKKGIFTNALNSQFHSRTALCKHVDCELGRERNWEKGLPESSLISSQFRHLMGYTSGVSEDTPEYNLTANFWNAAVLLEEYLRVQDGVMSGDVLDVEKNNDH